MTNQQTVPYEVIDRGGVIYLADGTILQRLPNQSIKKAMDNHKNKNIKGIGNEKEI